LIEKMPSGWRDLQDRVAAILNEVGLKAETTKTIKLVRGQVEIDVYATNPEQIPASVVLCECKLWETPVSQTVVHSFRTVVADSGANQGLLISKLGFQAGAHSAAEHSNVKLVNWAEFQGMFVERWYLRYFATELQRRLEPLVEYTEPFNSRVFRKADALSADRRERFKVLRAKYSSWATFTLALRIPSIPFPGFPRAPPLLPLRQNLNAGEYPSVPLGWLNCSTYRELLDLISRDGAVAIAEFDQVFGGRA
jgi:restriction system protein